MSPRLNRLGRTALLGALVGLVLLFVTLLAVYASLGQDQGSGAGSSSTSSIVAPSGVPRFLYDKAAPAGTPFRPRNGAVSGARVFIADSEGGRVAVLDLADGPDAELLLMPVLPDEVPEPGLRAARPTDVEVMGDGTLLVADSANGRIWRLLQDGRFIGDFLSEEGMEASGLISPVGLALGNGEVLVTDVGDQTVKVFSTSGSFLRAFGGEGFRPGSFSYPNSLTVGPDGEIYVADSNNRRIQVLDSDGGVVDLIEEDGEGNRLALPRAVGFDRFARLHVVDTFGRRVFVYGPDGVAQDSYGGESATGGELDNPEGIVITPDRIVVSDGGNRRLVVYSY